MRIFVTGGTGAIGAHTLPALVRSGHSVTALVRSPEKEKQVRREGASPARLSIYDRGALTQAFRGFDAVVNLASALPPSSKFMSREAWEENRRIRTEGSAAISDAALAAGVPRLLQESVSMIYADQADRWIDETNAVEESPMALTNLAAEASAARFRTHGGLAVTLRFGWFYGPRATHSEEFLALARRGLCVMMGRPAGFVSSIHVRDAAADVEAALSVPAGVYNVTDDYPVTKREYADALAAAVDRQIYIRAPGRLALLLGQRTTSLTRSLRVSNRKFCDASGWVPQFPSVREGLLALAKYRQV